MKVKANSDELQRNREKIAELEGKLEAYRVWLAAIAQGEKKKRMKRDENREE